MPYERKLSWQEITGILARLGMDEVYRAGVHRVYVDNQGRRIPIHLTMQWDVPFDMIARALSDVGVSRTEVEAALESLYSDH